MSWRFALDLDGQPAGWSDKVYASRVEARGGAFALFGEGATYWTAWVEPQDYAALMPPATQLLSDMREQVAEAGGDTSSFDSLVKADVVALDQLLRRAVKNWEAWVVKARPGAASSVLNVTRKERHTS